MVVINLEKSGCSKKLFALEIITENRLLKLYNFFFFRRAFEIASFQEWKAVRNTAKKQTMK